MGWGRLEAMLQGLPTHDSLFMTACLGPERTSWDQTQHLLAAVIDAVQGLRWTTAAGTPYLETPPYPKPIPRPGDSITGPEREALTPDEYQARMSRPRVALDSTERR